MKEKYAFIYVNADSKIGSGHFWRCLSIANELIRQNIAVNFIYSSLSPFVKETLTLGKYRSHEINNDEPKKFTQIIKNRRCNNSCSLLIVDSDNTFFYSKEFQLEIINSGIGLMIITVNPSFHYYAHILLNQNIIACYQEYVTESYTRKLFGPGYFIFNEQFRKIGLSPVKSFGKNVFIGFGSADPCHYTLQLIGQLLNTKNLFAYTFHVVVGALNEDHPRIKELCEQHSDRVNLYYDIDDVARIMLQCNVAICSPGLMYWELTLMGVRSIIFSSSPREKAIADFLHDKKFAFAFQHWDNAFDEAKFKLLEALFLNLSEEHFDNFSLLREKLNPHGISKIGEEIHDFFEEKLKDL